jgi:hypothetical protein
MAWLGDRLALVQDDASFVALVDPATGLAEAIPLPAGPDGKRLFDETRGNKELKLDLEACFAAVSDDGAALIALGSGSKPARERIVVLRYAQEGGTVTEVRVIDATSFYAGLRGVPEFSGSELNIEGVVRKGDDLLLFQRGNGAERAGHSPVNAVGRVSYRAFRAYLEANAQEEPPQIEAVRQYELGEVSQVPYTFTDATVSAKGTILFLASAEDSSSAVSDGAVYGTLVGELRDEGVRLTPLRDEDGKLAPLKAEGIAFDRGDPQRAYVVVDMDDPDLPSELLEVRLAYGI